MLGILVFSKMGWIYLWWYQGWCFVQSSTKLDPPGFQKIWKCVFYSIPNPMISCQFLVSTFVLIIPSKLCLQSNFQSQLVLWYWYGLVLAAWFVFNHWANSGWRGFQDPHPSWRQGRCLFHLIRYEWGQSKSEFSSFHLVEGGVWVGNILWWWCSLLYMRDTKWPSMCRVLCHFFNTWWLRQSRCSINWGSGWYSWWCALSLCSISPQVCWTPLSRCCQWHGYIIRRSKFYYDVASIVDVLY